MNATTDDGDRATGRWVANQLSDALGALKAIATTGDESFDADLLLAEQAMRRVKNAANKDPN